MPWQRPLRGRILLEPFAAGRRSFRCAKARLAWLAAEYGRAQAQANVGGAVVRVGEIEAPYALVRTEAGLIAKEMGTTDDAVRAAPADPALAAVVNVDASAADLVRQTLDQLVATPAFERFAPQYALASLLVDYGYDATRWALSGQRILRGDAVSGRGLEAVAALTKQIRRTVEWQAACRAGHCRRGAVNPGYRRYGRR